MDGKGRLRDVKHETVERGVDRVVSLLCVTVHRRGGRAQAAEIGVQLPPRTLPLRCALRADALGTRLRFRVRLGRHAAAAAAPRERQRERDEGASTQRRG